VLAEQTQKTENLLAFLPRKHVDLQIEMIAPLAKLRLSILTYHENWRGVRRPERDGEIEQIERIRIPNAEPSCYIQDDLTSPGWLTGSRGMSSPQPRRRKEGQAFLAVRGNALRAGVPHFGRH
jgi:hypothetical protein